MTCGEVRDRVAPFLDGQLSEAEAREIGEHLDDCEPCRRLVLGLGSLPLGRHAPVPARPPEFWGSMDRAIAQAARRPVPRTARVRAWFQAPVTLSRWTVLVVLAALALAVGLHAVRGGPTPIPLQALAPRPAPDGTVVPVSHAPVRHHY